MYSVGDRVRITDAMNPSYIGKIAKITKVNPDSYKLNIGGGDWLHSMLEKVEKLKYHTVTIGGEYRHYKNKKRYKVVDTACHTETNENLVIYYCLDDEFGEYRMFARPKEMFEEGLVIDSEIVPRFELITPKVDFN